MENPLKSLVPKDPQGSGMGAELGEKMNQVNNARRALNPSSGAKRAEPIGAPAPMKPVQGPYGSGAGEKRIDVKDMVKPLGQMHKGGTVPKTGPYIMKEGEKVLTPEQHGHLSSALSLAQGALSHDEAPEPPKAEKVGHDMHIRRLDDKTFHVRSGHTAPGDHPDQESSAPDMKGLIKHLQDHFGKDEPESPGVEAAESTVGLK